VASSERRSSSDSSPLFCLKVLAIGAFIGFFLISVVGVASYLGWRLLASRNNYLLEGDTRSPASDRQKSQSLNGYPVYDGSVTVGILHSLTGTMAISESTLVDTEIMAIDEINAAGGVEVDGKKYKIEYIVEDGASDWPTFAEKSKKLIDQDQVPVVFGGWTSASRKAMLPVYESKNALLFYPIQYEGQECSNNIFYTGAIPNQQSEPATFFMFKNSPAAGKPFFLVGSDYVFPRTSNTITKEQLKSLGGEVVGEDYLPLGNTEVAPIIAKIKKALPDGGVIINTLNGDQNVAFFKQIQDAGITPANGYYVMSYSIAEEEIGAIGPEFLEGHYGAWNYMMSIDTPASKKFAADFKAKYGADRVVADPQESAYNMVYLWKKGVEKAGTFDDDKVREALVGVTFDAPQGPIEVRPNHHISQIVRIGKIAWDGQFEIIEESDYPIDPQAWNQFEPTSKGFACDWTDFSKGEKYRL
jgi:urea transport system substrate-binding protein